MGRKPIKPQYDDERLMQELFNAVSDSYNNPTPDEAVDGHKKMELVAEEFEISRLKVRKILISTGEYTNAATREAARLRAEGLKTSQIAERMNIAPCTVTSLLPYEKVVYSLSELSVAADRVKRYRMRKAAVEEVISERSSIALWRAIIWFQNYPFRTAGRGEKPGVKFKYTVPEERSTVGQRYDGESILGWGNEIVIKGREKSIVRSSVDYALQIALNEAVTGPKQLKVYGSSYLFAIFKRFGLV